MMKKKQTIAILLSVLLLTSVTLPGTWATDGTESEPVGDVTNESDQDESKTDTETGNEPESESATDTESESATDTEKPVVPEPVEPEPDPETTEPEPAENPLYASFTMLMDDETMDSKVKWDELCEIFQLDEDMDVMEILKTIYVKLELKSDEKLQFIDQFRNVIETILDEIRNAVSAPDGIPALVEALMATDALADFENIVNTYLTENNLDVIFFEDPAEFDRVNDYYYYLENGEWPNHDPIIYDQYGNLISGDDGSLNENEYDTNFGGDKEE